MADPPEPSTAQGTKPTKKEGHQLRKLSADERQAILMAHSRWVTSDGKEGQVAYLQRTDLTFANLAGANLAGARLDGSDSRSVKLRGADLGGTNLKGAILRDADLEGANCLAADFEEADLQGANLQNANLEDANLQNAILERTKLQGARLQLAKLQGTDIQSAHLNGADFRGAILPQAELEGANLQGGSFSQASIWNADLREANLQDSQLQEADLHEANLDGANLKMADLTAVNLDQASLQNANLQRATLIDARLSRCNLMQADFRDAQLGQVKLRNADLREANLLGADLHGATLEGAMLQKADFTSANLQYASFEHVLDTEGELLVRAADLKGASFRNADLSDAALSDVSGLQADQLAGSNLSSAKLPPDIKEFEALEHVAEISKHARNIFLGVVGACVYSWLSIATTTDVALITGSTATPLPIIQTPVSIAGFYWAAPPILFVLYVYLHLYLQRMWEGMAELPAVFPDGRTLDKRVYPWLLSGLVAANVALLKERRPPSSWLQVGLSIIAAWGLVPFTLFLFWARYLTRHDWPWTIWHVILFVAAAAYGFASYRLAKATLRGERPSGQGIIGRGERPNWRHLFQGLRNVEHRWVLATALLTSILTVGAIEGTPGGEARSWRSWIPSPTTLFNLRTVAELTDLDVSQKPVNWTGAELAQVKGAQLRGADLRGARARGAFLARADLRSADLQRADFAYASFREARLDGANLRNTNLFGADLRGADLRGANLIDARGLTSVQLHGACGNNKTKLPAGMRIPPCNPAKR